MYKIKTPNIHYNGVTYGVQFIDGIGTTESEEIKNILVYDFGYEEVEEVKQENKTTSKKRK